MANLLTNYCFNQEDCLLSSSDICQQNLAIFICSWEMHSAIYTHQIGRVFLPNRQKFCRVSRWGQLFAKQEQFLAEEV